MTLLAMLDAGESGFAGFTMSAMSAGPGSVLAVKSPMISSGVAFSSSATLAHSTTRGGRARGCWKSIADADPAERLHSCQDSLQKSCSSSGFPAGATDCTCIHGL